MKLKTILKLTLIACAALCVLIFSSNISKGIINGLQLAVGIVVPSLFPFSVCALLLYGIASESAFFRDRSKQKILIYIMSLLGGFPVGAKLIEEGVRKGKLSKKDTNQMLAFCINPAPSFVITAIGDIVYRSKIIGIILYSAGLLSSLFLFILFSGQSKTENYKDEGPSFSEPLSNKLIEAVNSSTYSMLEISAFIALFAGIKELLFTVLGQNTLTTLANSLLEITVGIFDKPNLFIASFLLGFSGFCVHFQIMSICSVSKPKYKYIAISKSVHGILNIVFTCILLRTFNVSIPSVSPQVSPFSVSTNSILFSVLFLCCAILFMASTKRKSRIL